MKNVDDELKRSAKAIINILIKPSKSFIQAYKCGSLKKERDSLIRDLNKLYNDLKYIQDGRINYCCEKYENLDLLSEEEVKLQREINDILIEIYNIKKEIENELNKESG
jgi:hypothetical protein